MNITKKISKRSEFYVFLIILILGLVIQFRTGLFFTNNNIVDLLRSIIVPSIYALCALLAFVSTGPDVSFPLVAALSSFLSITVVTKFNIGGPWFIPYLIGVFFGACMGALNGFIIVKYKFNSLIVTLGTSSIFSGILLGVFEAGRTELSDSLKGFAGASLLTVKNAKTGLGSTLPMVFLIMIVLYIIAYFVLNHTMVGRGIYAIGGDEVSAERAGFNVERIRFGVFVVNGMLAAIAGLSYAVISKLCQPTEYAGSEMTVIAAIILGGTRLTGGVGTLKGCILGTLLLTMVTNSLILIGIPVVWQKVFIGAIIIIGTGISAMQAHNSKKVKYQIKKETS